MPKWSLEELALLTELYSDNSSQFIADKLGRTIKQIYSKAFILGLKKSESYMQKILEIEAERLKKYGNESRFQKGMQTWNKGVKGYMGANKTSFPKGNIPLNIREIGEERIDKDGHVLVKIAHKVWVRKQRVIWESVHGKIPKGYILRCKDGNKHNFDINNLFLITMAENMKMNGSYNYPIELQQTIRLVNKLKRITHEKQNSRP